MFAKDPRQPEPDAESPGDDQRTVTEVATQTLKNLMQDYNVDPDVRLKAAVFIISRDMRGEG